LLLPDGERMTHLQTAITYRARFPRTSPEYAAVDGLIDVLIENATFDYATEHELAYRKAGTR
jgi:hypothetical protein